MSGGVLVAFETEEALADALKALRAAKAGSITTYTPKPIEERHTIIPVVILAGFFGYLVANRMPRLYEPVDECRAMRRAIRDLYCVAVQTEDPDQIRTALRDHHFASIEEFGT
jgi:hypothetical protein